jgi:ribosomal protein S27E
MVKLKRIAIWLTIYFAYPSSAFAQFSRYYDDAVGAHWGLMDVVWVIFVIVFIVIPILNYLFKKDQEIERGTSDREEKRRSEYDKILDEVLKDQPSVSKKFKGKKTVNYQIELLSSKSKNIRKIVSCPHCNEKTRVSVKPILEITCPHCSKTWIGNFTIN